ncbi:MAG TPA: SufD family Fe-S cluster assembly protein [Methanothermobacter sp.]|nr:ABC-type transport system, permease component [Methanothermobacter sp. MT-2]HHW04586.1 SufD family Fe-S cluster assembly protein [Methanothermobacter sp.]HOK72050.1 SufD family Fe-S cluster assembly protein [Methanothermobacter sp.]HOL68363.1 SufD family Fe-S cluster assembly protein [Methanothermobacter sp.]HPQ04121.1 SufD family Fe-S cluster assembly protein [Methanothermobacter sp.]
MLPDAIKKAEKAKEKKAAYGYDIDLEKFIKEEAGEHERINKATEVPKKMRETLLKVGVDPTEKERAGTFIQVDQSGVYTSRVSKAVEVMGLNVALEKYDWLKDYMWKVVAPDTDKYTAHTALREAEGDVGGYFIRSKPNSREIFPIQACMFIGDEKVMQTLHNIIIAEENSELHIITGCATGEDVSSALHLGISEFYIKEGAKVTFTMVHNWAEQVEVRPRTGIILGDNATYINNYILTSPVKSIQSYPTAYCTGENSRVVFQSILGGRKESVLDLGSRVILEGKGSSAEIVSRAVSKDKSEIYSRGHLAGRVPEVKGHLECHGLVLSDDSMIYAVPELVGSATDLEMSHEAAVGKIAEEEILYLTSRGLTEDEAASMIVRGFLSMDIKGLPPELAAETKKMLDMSLKGM